MKIVLTTTPQAKGDLERAGLPFLGIGYIARHLLNDGHIVEIADAHTNLWSVARTVEEIANLKPEVVGINASTNNRFQAIDLIRQLKQKNPNLFIFAGGQHFSLTHEDAMKKIPALNAIIRGEGEITAVELMRAIKGQLKFEQVLGLTYRDASGNIQINAERPFAANLDDLLTPAWELFNMDLYQRTMDDTNIRSVGVISSRGCPNRCVYCCNAAFGQASLRLRSPEKFIDEVEYLNKKYGFKGFDFWDDTLTVSHDHVRAICEQIKKRSLDIKWYARARVNTVNKELLATMFAAGCIRISYGVESGSPRILRLIKKNISLDEVRQAIIWSSEAGMLVTVNFMVNLPYENWDDLRQTVALMKDLRKIPRVNPCYGFTIIYPGTEMESWARKEGWMQANFSWNSPYESKKYKVAGIDKSLFLLEMPELKIEKVKAYLTRELARKKGFFRKALNKIRKARSLGELFDLIKVGARLIINK